MNSFKEEDESAQSIIINIECCQNCGLHSWFTHHQEEKYELYFNQSILVLIAHDNNIILLTLYNLQVKSLIEKEIENVTVEKNLIPNNLIKLENRFNQEDINSFLDIIQNKPVQYPRIGSFEITIFNVTIFSKITCSAWPHYGSIIYTLKNIIQEKIQNKVVIHYSVLKSDDQDNSNLRDSQQLNVKMISSQQYQGKKSSPSSPRAHNGIKIPPIQHSSRSNSPRMKNYLLPLEYRNDEISQQPQVINSSFQKDKSLNPIKNLPPIIQNHDKKGIIKDQKSYVVKTNFYKQSNQDEKFKALANPRYQNGRANSPLLRDHNIYIRKTNLQGEEQNILIKSQNLTNDDSKEENSEIFKSMPPNFERKTRDPQVSSPVKVRFSNRNENEKSQERDQQTNNSSFLKPIQRKQEQEINSNSKNGVGLICDMKIKTVKLPYKTVYSNLKLANNKNQNSLSPKQNSNLQPNQKNRLILNNTSKPTGQIQNQIETLNETGTQQEEQSQENLQKLQNSQNYELSNDKQQINQENIQEEQKGDLQQKQAIENSHKIQIPKEAQTGSKDLKKVKKSNQDSPISINKSNLNDTHKKVYSLEKTEIMYNEHEMKKQNLTIQHNTKKNTINNLSKIEFIKSDVNSSCSLFSNVEQKEGLQQNLLINDDDFSQKVQKTERKDSQFSKEQMNTDYKNDTGVNFGQQEENCQHSAHEVDQKNKDEISKQNKLEDIKEKIDQQNTLKEKEENEIKNKQELNQQSQNENLSDQEIVQIYQNQINLKNAKGDKQLEEAMNTQENIFQKQIENGTNIQEQNTLINDQQFNQKNQNGDKSQDEQIQETQSEKQNKSIQETQQMHEDQSKQDQECQQNNKVEEQSQLDDFEEQDAGDQEQKEKNDGSVLSEKNKTNENEDDYDEEQLHENKQEQLDKYEEDEYEEDEEQEEFMESNQNIQKIKEIVFKYLFKLEQKAINYIIQLQEQQTQESQQENYQSNISKLKENHQHFKQNTLQLENDIDQTTQIIKKSTFKQD
ncbi:hypothetical protein TTHERM_00420630 (macronuclear) [Tetrahymena thermophila SB210]|uniref:Uncharacterized protein n=1 Tax=Tetrahymena thermophila (strain SB210) TaxID=312017 RepID=I7MD80_TETTS|nr:hypothetical protein TTHERM_00420630 [Tetrahymena thermophila SB210]EAR85655.2 hypothetical protein TTHERM_00420630 [Tetrahymena thermophila SB210]|eukprot:XP_001033318.2 hypothetical protein TTHERM_00420630 [Tetrahymena thermophila SB210]